MNKKTQMKRNSEYNTKILGGNLSFAAAEAYKLLRTNLAFSVPSDDGCKIIGFTSAMRGEGKTTTSINTAYTIAQTGKRVLLIEADLRLPNIARRLNIAVRPGITNLLAGQCAAQKILQPSGLIDGLWVATAGDIPPNPAELLESERMQITLKAFADVFDMIVVDLPPVGVVSDALGIAKYLDGMAVVARQNYCPKKSVCEIVRQLKFANAKVLGLVITGSDIQQKNYRKYGQKGKDYGYGYENSSRK